MTRPRPSLAALCAALALSACSDAGPAPSNASAESVHHEGRAGRAEPAGPARVFFNLTAYGWYARGEPLMLDGRAYGLAGGPKPVPFRELERVGDYQGVDVYAAKGRGRDTLLVPVFDGYWLPFSASAAPVAEGPAG
ncbi:MAG TPA: hypothetical protein VFQ38_04420 [Longimicrobiales bacterium]|nr:hypothetical protein [Longimicrobiales bacterium]